MEANELMIGDWVNGWDGRWHPVCVSTISSYPEHRPTIVACGGYGYSLEDQVQPIPLTTEILEKSGFNEIDLTKIDGEFYDYFFVLRGKRAGIEKAIFQLSKLRNQSRWEVATNSRDVIIIIKYVHELQHALRLAGIKKEIVL